MLCWRLQARGLDGRTGKNCLCQWDKLWAMVCMCGLPWNIPLAVPCALKRSNSCQFKSSERTWACGLLLPVCSWLLAALSCCCRALQTASISTHSYVSHKQKQVPLRSSNSFGAAVRPNGIE